MRCKQWRAAVAVAISKERLPFRASSEGHAVLDMPRDTPCPLKSSKRKGEAPEARSRLSSCSPEQAHGAPKDRDKQEK